MTSSTRIVISPLLIAITFFVFTAGLMPFGTDGLSSSVVAQDEPAEDVVDDAAEDEAADEADAAAPDAPKVVPKKNALTWLIQALGILYIVVFLFISFTFVALFVMNFLAARRENISPSYLVEGFEAHLNEKRYQDAYDMAKADDSFLGNVLSAGLAKLSAGYQPALEAMQEVGEEESMKINHRLSYLALIGTISPMVGLLGTVHGMINSFYSIAVGGSTPDPTKLAEGISQALITTLIGLLIAIPAIAVYNVLRNRADRLVLEVGILGESLMSRFENLGNKK